MTISAQSVFDGLLPERLSLKREADYFAPSNIALSKYWGKRDKELNLPLNSSLSISLHKWGSQTKISVAADGRDQVRLNGEAVDLEQPFARKLIAFVDRFRRGQNLPLNIQTFNSIPTAAGLASSASGFAALTGALDQAFGLGLPKDKLSMLARIGSGSASRSFWHGFVQWDRGELADGQDSFARHIDVQWQDFRIAIVNVTSKPKLVSSRDGMNHTVATSPLYKVWPEQAERDCADIGAAVQDKDFSKLGALAEANALAMHATMMAARPGLQYLLPESFSILEKVRQLRAEGHEVYATMDAGPNIKLIFLQSSEADVKANFPQAQIIEPFAAL